MTDTLRFMRSKHIQELSHKVEENFDLYCSEQDFEEYFENSDCYIQTHIPCHDINIKLVKSGSAEKDIANSMILYEYLSNLTTEQAADSRLWTYLCHFGLKDYTRTRWLNDQPSVEAVRNHFFVPPGIRGLIRDNAASRLWWMEHFAVEVYKISNITPERILKVLLFRTDVRANLLERTTTATNYNVSAAIIRLLDKSYDQTQTVFDRETFRSLMKEINVLGGYKLLDICNMSQLEEEFTKILFEKLKIESL